jgi:hypothetical protein
MSRWFRPLRQVHAEEITAAQADVDVVAQQMPECLAGRVAAHAHLGAA